MMDALDRVRDGVRTGHPDLRYTDAGRSIRVGATAPDGLDLSVGCGYGPIVAFDGWHEHVDDDDNALARFAFGLSGRCRPRVARRGRAARRWTPEILDGDRWVGQSTTGLLVVPFWRPERVEYRRDAVPNQR